MPQLLHLGFSGDGRRGYWYANMAWRHCQAGGFGKRRQLAVIKALWNVGMLGMFGSGVYYKLHWW